jgi:hypothetical protein
MSIGKPESSKGNANVRSIDLSDEVRTRLGASAKKRGALLISIGALLTISYFLATFSNLVQWTLLFAASVCAIWGWSIYNRGRQYLAPDANRLLQDDPRPRCVYLRPFNADDADSGNDDAVLLGVSEEEQIAAAMNEIGPFVAIGKPGELLPHLGAARIYVDDKNWREDIVEWLSKAQLVLVRPGFTESIEWEIAHIVRNIHPERLVILLPWDPQNGYEKFRLTFEKYFPKGLPEFSKRQWTPARSIYGLLYFNSDWTPHAAILKKPYYLRKFTPAGTHPVFRFLMTRYWLTYLLKKALQPVLTQLGLSWKKRAISPIVRPLVTLAILLVLLFVYLAMVAQRS